MAQGERNRRPESGRTLVEMLVALSVMAMMMVAGLPRWTRPAGPPRCAAPPAGCGG